MTCSCSSRRPPMRTEGGRGAASRGPVAGGSNPPAGAVIEYLAEGQPAGRSDARIPGRVGQTREQIHQQGAGRRLRRSRTRIAEQEADFNPFAAVRPPPRAWSSQGMNRFIWDMHYPDATTFPEMILWAGSTRGPMAIPGTYTVKLTANGKTQSQTFTMVKDPRVKTTPQDFSAATRAVAADSRQVVADQSGGDRYSRSQEAAGRIPDAVEGQSSGKKVAG